MRVLPFIMVGMLLVVILSVAVEIALDRVDGGRRQHMESDIVAASSLQSTLVDAESGVRGYIRTGRRNFSLSTTRLRPDRSKISDLGALTQALAPYLPQDVSGTDVSAAQTVALLRANWADAIRQIADNKREAAVAAVDAKAPMDRIRTAISGLIEARQTELRQWVSFVGNARTAVYASEIIASMVVLVTMIFGFGRITRAIRSGAGVQDQTERLFSMTDMLQSASGQDDTNEVLIATATTLLPGFSGALYVFNNSRDRLDLATRWGSSGENGAESLLPTSCWALKRGKAHMNLLDDGTLRCRHIGAGQVTLEIPMAARGELYGMLEVSAAGADAAQRLTEIKPVAGAMADAMSLALSWSSGVA